MDDKLDDKVERLHRRRRIARMFREGEWSPIGIVQKLGLPNDKQSYRMVVKDMRAVLRDWSKATAHDVEVWRTKQLVQYQKMAGEMLDAWEKSKRDRKKVRKRRRSGETGSTTETETERVDGNVGYLNIWMECMKAINQLTGLVSPNGVLMEKRQTIVQASTNFFATIQAKAEALRQGAGLPAPPSQEVIDVPKPPEPIPEPPPEVKQLPPPDKTDWHKGADFPGAQ